MYRAPPLLVRLIALGVFASSLSLSACTPTESSSIVATLTPGGPCDPDDGARVPCLTPEGVCAYQVCDPVSRIASQCTLVDCSEPPLPPYTPSDGGTGCSPGARRDCTTPDLLAGFQLCDVSRNWMMCIPRGTPYDAGVTGSDAGPPVPCGSDPDVLGAVSCTVGVGACAATGTWICVDGAKQCSAMSGSPSTEVVDDIDNDCNGLVDDGITRSCFPFASGSPGVGVCRYGTQSYDPVTDTWSTCTGAIGPTTEEPDNDVDEDCNGGLLFSTPCGGDDRVGDACTAGIGACMGTGTWSCVGTELRCSATAGTPSPEVCDGLDNDCNGAIDMNVESCYTGRPGSASVGICRPGYRVCTAGAWGSCEGEVLPALEVCGNDVDEDCNGIRDACVVCGSDPRIATTTSCTVGIGECARTGTYVCSAGVVSCSAVPGDPVSESCDGEDDDCDGSVDEEVTRACTSYDMALAGRGICRVGYQDCVGFDEGPIWGACTGEVGPAREICGDTVDQDCSGMDLACTSCGSDPRIGMACTVGRGACATAGTFQCTGGTTINCVPSTAIPTPTPEVCDGIDNDCDGLTDNPPGGGVITRSCYPFGSGLPGVGICVNGTQTCASGTFGACTGAVGPATEVCDALDNDCDGGTNEGLVCGGSDAGVPMADAGVPASDAGTPGTDSGAPMADAGSPGSDSGAPGGITDVGTSGTACPWRPSPRSGPATMTVQFNHAALGTCASGWVTVVYDQFGCRETSAAGASGLRISGLANSGHYAVHAECAGSAYDWPAGAVNAVANTQGVSSILYDSDSAGAAPALELADSETRICVDPWAGGMPERPMVPGNAVLFGTCP